MHCIICTSSLFDTLDPVNGISIYRCLACGAVLADCAQPDASFYEDDYVGDSGFGYADGAYFEASVPCGAAEVRRLEVVSQYDAVIEIGAGAGQFQALLAAHDVHSFGVERSSTMRRRAKDTYKISLLDNLSEAVAQLKPDMRYCLVLIEVIEHMSDPDAFLRALIALPSRPPDGIFFTTPNADRVRSVGSQWEQVKPPEHLVLFSAESFERFLEPLGYEIDHVHRYQSAVLTVCLKYFGRRSDKKFPILWILTGIARALDGPLCRLLPSQYASGLEVSCRRRD